MDSIIPLKSLLILAKSRRFFPTDNAKIPPPAIWTNHQGSTSGLQDLYILPASRRPGQQVERRRCLGRKSRWVLAFNSSTPRHPRIACPCHSAGISILPSIRNTSLWASDPEVGSHETDSGRSTYNVIVAAEDVLEDMVSANLAFFSDDSRSWLRFVLVIKSNKYAVL